MKVFILSLTIGITCITLASCERKQVTLVLCFIDLSSRDSVTIEWYKEVFKEHILRNALPETKVVVLPVDYASQTGSQELLMVDFSRNQYGNVFAGMQSAEIEKQQHKDSVSAAIRQFDRVFDMEWQRRQQLPVGTDLFGALLQCSKYAEPGQKMLVILLSDMLEFTDQEKMNFESNLNSEKEIEEYLSSAPNVDLQGKQIVVLTGPHRGMTPVKYTVVKTFWEKYLEQCNGELVDYSSGAVSKLETFLREND